MLRKHGMERGGFYVASPVIGLPKRALGACRLPLGVSKWCGYTLKLFIFPTPLG